MRYAEYKETDQKWTPSIPLHWDYWRAKRIFDNPKEKNDGNKEVYLSTDPENIVGKHVYEKVGFRSENKMIDDEELFKIVLE